MTTSIPARADINGGPSKFDLMLALFDRKQVNARRIEFNLSSGKTMTAVVVITEVGIEDGSGESWLFKGAVRDILLADEYSENHMPPSPRRVHGWYRTDTRKGWIETVD